MSKLFGGGSSTTVIQPAAASAEERELQQLAIDLSRQQLEAIQSQTAFQEQQFASLEPLRQQQLETGALALEQQQVLQPLQQELLQLELEAIRRGPAATDEQKALIAEATESAITTGEIDIERFQTQGLDIIREQIAPSLGLRPSDSPIVDRSEQLLAETARQQGSLVSQLRGQQASAELNFPLAAGQLQAGRTQAQQGIVQSAEQFLAQLRQQILQTNIGATSSVGSLGLGLAGIPFAGSGVLSSFDRGTTTTESGGGLNLGGIGGVLTGISGFF